MIRFILIILSCSAIFSCKESIPPTVIKPKKMQEVLWDVVKAEALAQQIVKSDSSKTESKESQKLVSRVFAIHNITKEQFDKSYNYYTQHPDIMRGIFDSISIQQTRKSFLERPMLKKIITDSVKNKTQ